MKEQSKPWYREPWPWLLMAGPAAVVVAGIFTTALAVMTEDGLVADDYYRQGLAINQVLARDARALELHYSADVRFSGPQVSVVLHGAAPHELRLRLIHPTRAGHDAGTVLGRGPAGVYAGRIPDRSGGPRRLILEDASGLWRLTGDWRGRDGDVRLAPSS